MDIFVLISGYILEYVILLIWYKAVVRKELSKNKKINAEREEDKKIKLNIVKRTLKVIFVHRKIFICSIFGNFDCDDTKKQNLEMIKRGIFDLICVSGWTMAIVIFDPIFASYIGYGNWLDRFFGLAVIVGMLLEQLREKTQKYINELSKYIENVLLTFETGADRYFPTESDIVNIRFNRQNRILIGVAVGLSVVLLLLMMWLQKIEWSKETRIIFGLIGFLMIGKYLFVEKMKDKGKKIKEENGYLKFSSEYMLIEDEIKEICERLDLSKVEFLIEYRGLDNACTRTNKNGDDEVVVYKGILESFEKIANEYGCNLTDMFLVTVLHELGHVYYKDSEFTYSKRTKNACIIWLLIFVGSVCLLLWRIIPAMLYLFIIGIELLIGNVMCDKRYWKQIAELKADRLAVKSFAGGTKAFVDFWGREEKIMKDQNKSKELDESNFLYRYYKRYIEEEAHPAIKRRVYLVLNRETWKWWEYVEHALIIRKWRWLKQGWNGM